MVMEVLGDLCFVFCFFLLIFIKDVALGKGIIIIEKACCLWRYKQREREKELTCHLHGLKC